MDTRNPQIQPYLKDIDAAEDAAEAGRPFSSRNGSVIISVENGIVTITVDEAQRSLHEALFTYVFQPGRAGSTGRADGRLTVSYQPT